MYVCMYMYTYTYMYMYIKLLLLLPIISTVGISLGNNVSIAQEAFVLVQSA